MGGRDLRGALFSSITSGGPGKRRAADGIGRRFASGIKKGVFHSFQHGLIIKPTDFALTLLLQLLLFGRTRRDNVVGGSEGRDARTRGR